jgi:large subunit ribosomal protein L12
MEYIHAAILLHKAGKTIDEENLTKVLKAAGVDSDPVRVKALVASLEEVDIDNAIKTAPTGLAAPATAPAAATPQTKEKKPAEEEKKEEKEEEKEKEEAAMEGLGALFG